MECDALWDGEIVLRVALLRRCCLDLFAAADVAALLCTSSSLQAFIQEHCGGQFHVQLNPELNLAGPGVSWLRRYAHLVRELEVRQQHGRRSEAPLQAVTAALQGASGRLRLHAFACHGNAASAALLAALVSRQCPLVRLDLGLHCKNEAEQGAAAAALAALTGLRSLALSPPASELLAPVASRLCCLTFLELREVSAARLASLASLPNQLQALQLSCKGWTWHALPAWSLRLATLQALTSLRLHRGRGDLVFRLQPGDQLPTSLRVLSVDDVTAEAAGPVMAPLHQLRQLTLSSCSTAGSLAVAQVARMLPSLQRVRLRYSIPSDVGRRQPENDAAAQRLEQEAVAAAWRGLPQLAEPRLEASVVVDDN